MFGLLLVMYNKCMDGKIGESFHVSHMNAVIVVQYGVGQSVCTVHTTTMLYYTVEQTLLMNSCQDLHLLNWVALSYPSPFSLPFAPELT